MLLKKGVGVSCCDLAAEVSSYLPVTKKTGTCYAEKKPTSTLSPSPCQQARRKAFSDLTSLWLSLSAPQKSGWLDLALVTPFTNQCSELYYLSAFNLFAKINGVLLNFGGPYMLPNAPANYTPPTSNLVYSYLYPSVSYSSHKPLWFLFNPVAGYGIQIFSHRGEALPSSLLEKYYNLLATGLTVTDV